MRERQAKPGSRFIAGRSNAGIGRKWPSMKTGSPKKRFRSHSPDAQFRLLEMWEPGREGDADLSDVTRATRPSELMA
jgi:hypothetical protein